MKCEPAVGRIVVSPNAAKTANNNFILSVQTFGKEWRLELFHNVNLNIYIFMCGSYLMTFII